MDWHARFSQQAHWTADLRRYLFHRVGCSPGSRVLEVGCGTGAVLESFPAQNDTDQNQIFGVDINREFLNQAKSNRPLARLVQGDAHWLPYENARFDLVFCHFLLLWLNDPSRSLNEMRRVTRPGGWVIAFAEPDYGGRVDYPQNLAPLGQLQEQSLIRQGADTRLGRRIKALFHQTGLSQVETGVIGAQWGQELSENELNSEWMVVRFDLKDLLSQDDLESFRQLERSAWGSGERTIFVPTFYGFGRV